LNKKISSGVSVLFWLDRWFQGYALFYYYPSLYSIAIKPNIIVAEAYDQRYLNLQFRRQTVGNYLLEWNDLNAQLGTLQIQPLQSDITIWHWHASGIFSLHSFYEWLDFSGIINTDFNIVWQCKIP
jgi:hypothetical protein